jgi:(2Fe-2S) ferredoxin
MIYDIHIFVCNNQRKEGEKRSCGEQHGLELVGAFKKQINDLKLPIKIRVNRAGCLGICDFGPTIVIYPEAIFYVGVEVADVDEIVKSHILNHKPVERLLLKK